MQVSLEKLSGLERKLNITVPADVVDKEVSERLHKLAGKAKVPGFRPGKAPFALLQKRYGESVRAEVIEKVIRESFTDAIKQEKLAVVGYPKLEIITSKANEPLNFSATFEVYPEAQVNDLTKLEASRYVAEITEQDVNEMLEKMRKEQVTWKEVKDTNRAIQKGDRINIDFSVAVHTDKPQEPKWEKDVNFILGNGYMWPEFEAPIYKSKVGDELSFTLKFPLTHRDKELVGRFADFVVKIHKVFEPIILNLDDELAKKLKIKDGTYASLVKEVRSNLEHELQRVLKELLKREILDKLYDANVMDVPKALIAQEIAQMQERWQQRFKHLPKDQIPPFPEKDSETRAKRFVTLGLLLASIIKENGIKVGPEELRAKVEEMASIYEDAQKVVNWYFSNKEQLMEVESMLLEEKAIDYLAKNIKLIDKPISYKDAMERK